MVLGRKVVTPSSVTPSDVAAIRNAKRPAHPSQNSRASLPSAIPISLLP